METVDTRAVDAAILRDTLTLITPVAGRLTADFYTNLFAYHPTMRSLFPPDEEMGGQRDKLFAALISLVKYYDQPDFLTPVLEDLGRRHAKYGATIDGYAAVGHTLNITLQQLVGERWPATYAQAWDRAYMFAAGTMLAAAAVARRPISVGGHR